MKVETDDQVVITYSKSGIQMNEIVHFSLVRGVQKQLRKEGAVILKNE